MFSKQVVTPAQTITITFMIEAYSYRKKYQYVSIIIGHIDVGIRAF